MVPYVITCCSTCDLTAEKLKELNISYANFHFSLGSDSYFDDFGQSLSFSEFYKRMESGEPTKTAQVNISEYLALFEPILASGNDILHITLSSGISGTINSAKNAAQLALEKYPERKIKIIDSLGASSGYGLLLTQAAKLRDSGYSLDELYNWIEENKLRLNHWFFSTDLSYYVKGGRISKTAGFVGTMLGICPLMNMDQNGCLIPLYKIRTKKRVILEIVEKMKLYADDNSNYSGKCYISQANCLADAQAVASYVEQAFPNLDGKVEIFNVGTTIASHTGPGTVALFFFGRNRELPLLP